MCDSTNNDENKINSYRKCTVHTYLATDSMKLMK